MGRGLCETGKQWVSKMRALAKDLCQLDTAQAGAHICICTRMLTQNQFTPSSARPHPHMFTNTCIMLTSLTYAGWKGKAKCQQTQVDWQWCAGRVDILTHKCILLTSLTYAGWKAECRETQEDWQWCAGRLWILSHIHAS